MLFEIASLSSLAYVFVPYANIFLSTYFSVLKSSRAFSNILLNDIHIEMVVLFSGAVSSFSPGNLTNAVR